MTTLNECAQRTGTITLIDPSQGIPQREITIDMDTIRAAHPVVKSGRTYPDLASQVVYSLEGIERVESHMVGEMCQFLYERDLGCITTTILNGATNRLDDYMHLIGSLKEDFKADYPDFPWDMLLSSFTDCHNDVFGLTETVKFLISQNGHTECLKSQVERIELAQNGVQL